jgi:DNA-binding response OmpR family regulator
MTKVLVIDDEQSIRILIAAILEDEGYVVIQAADGYQGLDLLEQERPDLVILDVMMPGIDGVETLRRMREMDSHADVPVVMVSAGAAQSPADVDAFIRKPFNLADFLNTLECVLGR